MMHPMEYARSLLSNVTPLTSDCGLLCGHACCMPNGDAGEAVWLFPEEEALPMPWGKKMPARMPVTGENVLSLYCEDFCARDGRPFCCMIFPLVPYFSKKKNQWSVRMDRRAYAVCPLCAYGKKGLNPEFVTNAEKAVIALSQTEAGERFLTALAREEDAYHFSL